MRRLGLLLLLLGCGAKPDDTAPAAVLEADSGICATPITWASDGEGLVTQWCQPCHSVNALNRHGAPEAINFDAEAEVLALRARLLVVVLGEPATMPPSMPLPERDRALFEAWLTCAP